MTPIRVLLIVYPTITIILSSLMKAILKDKKWANKLIMLFIYMLSNIGIYYYTEGIQSKERTFGIDSTLVFENLSINDWLHILLVPNVFTFLYLIISYLILILLSLILQSKSKDIAL